MILGTALGCRAQTDEIVVQKTFKEEPLNQVLEWIENTYSIYIGYSKVLTQDILINAQFDGQNLEQTLESLLDNTNLQFQFIAENKILVGPKDEIPSKENLQITYTNYSGTIQDPTGNPLPFANILNLRDSTGVFSDSEGRFSLQIINKPQPVELKVSFIGYTEQLITLDPERSFLSLILEPATQRLNTITITDQLPPPALKEVFSNTGEALFDFKAMAMLGGSRDLFRQLQYNAGVKAYDDYSSRLQVRGSNADENMMVMDGMTLYNIDHLYGIFSAVHPGIFDKVQIHKNAFPIEYGGRTASVIELQSNDAIDGNIKSSVGFDLNTVSTLLRFPIGDKFGIITAGRFTHSDVTNNSFFKLLRPRSNVSRDDNNEGEDRTLLKVLPNFNFYDFYAKVQWKIDEKTLLSASFFTGFDNHTFNYEEDYTAIFNRREVDITETGQEDIFWTNEAVGLNLNRQWSERWRSSLNISQSVYETNSSDRFSILRTNRFQQEQERVIPLSSKDNSIQGYRLNLKNEWQPSNDRKLTWGYTLTSDEVDFDLINASGKAERRFNWNDQAVRHRIYGEYQQAISANWQLGVGLNGTRYEKNKQWYFSPRISSSLEINDQFSLKASWSLYFQFLRQLYHEDVFGNNQAIWLLASPEEFAQGITIPVASSKHFMIGGSWKRGSWELDVELFNIDRTGVLEYALLRPGFDLNNSGFINSNSFAIFEGEGQTKGIDFLLKTSANKYRAWLAYTLSSSTITLPRVNFGQPYASPEDSRHQLKFINEYEWSPKWSVSLSYIFASGLPYLDFSQLNQSTPTRRLLFYDTFLERYADYHRVDFGINFRTSITAGTSLELTFSIFNLFDRRNVKYRQFVFAIPNEEVSEVLGTELTLLPRIFNFGLNFNF